MRALEKMAVVAAAITAFAGNGAAAEPPGPLLQGQTVQLAPPERDVRPATLVTLAAVDTPDLDRGPMSHPKITADSTRAGELMGVVHDLGEGLAAAHALPAPASGDRLQLRLEEHVLFDAGSSMNAGIEAGFPRGSTMTAVQSASYVANYRLTVSRPGGGSRSFGCEARATGTVSRFAGQDVSMWTPLVTGAREDCLAQLVSRVRAGDGFLKTPGAPTK